jgi:type VI secretion system protein ImpL
MAHRYPIAGSSRNEASVKDLQRFVDPDSGLLPAFKRNEIGNLAGGEGLGVGDGKGPALVNPGMLNSIDKASSVGQVIASLSDRDNGFEIMLEPSANFTDIVFTLDGQEQHYRNGRSSWNRFAWPGTSTAPGARLDVVTLSGTGHRVRLPRAVGPAAHERKRSGRRPGRHSATLQLEHRQWPREPCRAQLRWGQADRSG